MKIKTRIKYVYFNGTLDQIIEEVEKIRKTYRPPAWESLEIQSNTLFGEREENPQERKTREQKENADKIKAKKKEQRERKILAQLKERYES